MGSVALQVVQHDARATAQHEASIRRRKYQYRLELDARHGHLRQGYAATRGPGLPPFTEVPHEVSAWAIPDNPTTPRVAYSLFRPASPSHIRMTRHVISQPPLRALFTCETRCHGHQAVSRSTPQHARQGSCLMPLPSFGSCFGIVTIQTCPRMLGWISWPPWILPLSRSWLYSSTLFRKTFGWRLHAACRRVRPWESAAGLLLM